ncbi:hypothetical protein BH11VER1_BH11VER1_27390 [soil metagenome]
MFHYHLTLLSLLSFSSLLAADLPNDPSKGGTKSAVVEPEKVWPEPVVVEPHYDGQPVPAPEGSVVLFNGQDAALWIQIPRKEDADQTERFRWKLENGSMEVVPRSGFISTSGKPITSGHLHLEWATPAEVKGDGQGRGNSGVFIEGFPELQVLDSFQNKTYFDGQAGAFYKSRPPLVNASRGPGLWQSYDIEIQRATVDNGKVVKPALITVRHNGVLVQDQFSSASPVQAGSLRFQDHLNPVRFRNIWFKPTL